MSHFETDRTGTAQAARDAATSHALVPLRTDTGSAGSGGSKLGRPSTDVLAQLIVSGEPELRPSRTDRTRVAAALYARTARLCA